MNTVVLFYVLFFYLQKMRNGVESKINISCLNGKKYVQNGENVSLNCSFSSEDVTATAWFKQTPGEKPLLIASAFRSSAAVYHNGFNKSGRFIAVTEQNTFTLNISNTEASDSATYFLISVRKALRLFLLHRAVSTNSPRTSSASLMLELTTVL
uniref:Ig-like domain-containing protein n=1 Tax=Astyanax mexicanus TaxID=7994 RepID=W5LLY9_ASTMX